MCVVGEETVKEETNQLFVGARMHTNSRNVMKALALLNGVRYIVARTGL